MTIIGQERIDELKKLAEKDMSLMTPEAFRNSFNFSWEDVVKFQEQQQGQLLTSLSKLENKISRASLDMSLHGMGMDPKIIDYAIDDFKAKASKLWEATVDKMCNYQAQKYDKARDKIKEQWKDIAGADFPILKTEDGKEVVFSWYRNEREGFFCQQGGDGPARISPDIIKEMDSSQLKEISDGFMHGLTKEQIEVYANPEYDSRQMQQLREGLEKGLDVSKYANPVISHDEMMKIRETLENTKQSPPIRHVGIKSQLTNEITQEFGLNIDIKNFDGLQLLRIEQGMADGLSPEQISAYANPELTDVAMDKIRVGLNNGIDKSVYEGKIFNESQLDQIQWGFEDGLDIRKYASPDFKANQMSEIRKGLLAGLDVDKYADPNIRAAQMNKIRKELEKGNDVDVGKIISEAEIHRRNHSHVLNSQTNNVNKVELSVGEGVSTPTQKEFGTPTVDYSKEFSDKMTNALLKTYEIHNKLGLGPPKELLELAQQGIEMNKQGLPVPLEMVAKIDSFAFNDKQIEQINMGLNHGLSSKDVAVYADPKIKAEKMEDWRKDLETTRPWRVKQQYGKPIEKNKEKIDDISR